MKNYIVFFSIIGLFSGGIIFAQMTTAVNTEVIQAELGDLCTNASSCSAVFESAFNSGNSAIVQRFTDFGLRNKLYSKTEENIVKTAPIEIIVTKANEITQCGNDTLCIVQRAQELIATASKDQNLSKAINRSEFTKTTEAIVTLNKSAQKTGITLEKCIEGELLSDDEEIACSKLLRVAAKQSRTISAAIPDVENRLAVAQRTENTDALASYIAQNGCTPLHPDIRTMDQCGEQLQNAFASGNANSIKAFRTLAVNAGPEYARQFGEMEKNFNKKLNQYVNTILPSEEYVLVGDAMVPAKDIYYPPEGKKDSNYHISLPYDNYYPYNVMGRNSMAAGCQNKYQNNPEKLKMCIQMAEEMEQSRGEIGIYPEPPRDYRCPVTAQMFPRAGCSYSLTEKTFFSFNGVQCEMPKLICNDQLPPIVPVSPVYPIIPSQPPYDVLGKKFDTIAGALGFCRSIATAVPVPMCMALEAQNNNVPMPPYPLPPPSVDCAAMPFTVLADFEIVRGGQTITDQGRRDAMKKYASCTTQTLSPGRSYLDIYRGGLYKLGGVWEACMNRLGNAANRSLIQNDLRENREPSWSRLSSKEQTDTVTCEQEAGYTSVYVPPGIGIVSGSCPATVLTLLHNDTSCHRMDFSYSDSMTASYSGAYMTAGMSGPYVLIKKDGTPNGIPESVVKNCATANERISLCTGGSIPITGGTGQPPAGQREQIWNTYGLRSWVRTDADQARIDRLKENCKNVPQSADVWMSGAGNMISLDFGMPDPAKCSAYAVSPPPPNPVPGTAITYPYTFIATGRVLNSRSEMEGYCGTMAPGSGSPGTTVYTRAQAECVDKGFSWGGGGSPPTYPIYPTPGGGGTSSCTSVEIAAFQNGGVSPASDCHYMDSNIPYAGGMSACLKNGVVSRDRTNCPSLSMAGNYSGIYTGAACTADRPYRWSGDATGPCITATECAQGQGTLSGTMCIPPSGPYISPYTPPYTLLGGGAFTCPAGSSWSGSVCMPTLSLGAPSCPNERSYMCNNVCSITPCGSTYTPPPSLGSCAAGMYWYTPPGGGAGYCQPSYSPGTTSGTCPSGYTGTPPNCTVTSTGIYTAPYATTCPFGQYWNGYSCITSSLPATGQFLCPNGSYVAVGTACPTVTAPTSCPPGHTGVPPNCAISGGIYTPPPPPTGTYTTPTSCPIGYYLSNGACVPSLTGITSGTCPYGGTYPNCTSMPPPTETTSNVCPVGYTGVPPNCTVLSTGTYTPSYATICSSGQYWNGSACMANPTPSTSYSTDPATACAQTGGTWNTSTYYCQMSGMTAPSSSSTMTPDEGCKQTYGSAASWNGTKCIGGTSPTASIIDVFRSWFGR